MSFESCLHIRLENDTYKVSDFCGPLAETKSLDDIARWLVWEAELPGKTRLQLLDDSSCIEYIAKRQELADKVEARGGQVSVPIHDISLDDLEI